MAPGGRKEKNRSSNRKAPLYNTRGIPKDCREIQHRSAAEILNLLQFGHFDDIGPGNNPQDLPLLDDPDPPEVAG